MVFEFSFTFGRFVAVGVFVRICVVLGYGLLFGMFFFIVGRRFSFFAVRKGDFEFTCEWFWMVFFICCREDIVGLFLS